MTAPVTPPVAPPAPAPDEPTVIVTELLTDIAKFGVAGLAVAEAIENLVPKTALPAWAQAVIGAAIILFTAAQSVDKQTKVAGPRPPSNLKRLRTPSRPRRRP